MAATCMQSRLLPQGGVTRLQFMLHLQSGGVTLLGNSVGYANASGGRAWEVGRWGT